MKPLKTPNNHSNFEKEEKVGGIILPDIKQYYKAMVIKQHGTGIKESYRSMEQNIEIPEINPHFCSQQLSKEAKAYN